MEALLTRSAGYLWTQSWQIALLVAVIAPASWALRNRSAHVRYLLWLLVLAKCLAPPVVQVPLHVLPAKAPVMVTVSIPLASPAEAIPSRPIWERPLPTLPPSSSAATPPSLDAWQWMAVGWLAGVALFVCAAGIKLSWTIRWLRRERRAPPQDTQTFIQQTFCSLPVKRPPRVWLVAGIGQPFVWGVLRGDVYLTDRFTQIQDHEHRKDILAHEISHVLRFDAGVNILQIIAQAIFWFHPLVWWANQRIRREREKCCDEMAIAHLNAKPKDYSTAILNTLIQAQESTRPVPSLAVAGPVKNLEERIRAMLKPGRKFCKGPSSVAATIVVLCALPTVPTALVLSARAQSKIPDLSLHQAAADGGMEQVKTLLARGANVNAIDGGRRTALHRACEKGRTEVANFLISKGAHINVTCWNGMTPLHYAAVSGDKQTVELLLNKGADINAKARDGKTPLFEAMASSAPGRKEVVELLAAKGARVPALHLAAYMGDMEQLKRSLQNGVDIDFQEGASGTALHAAANSGKKDIVEFVLSKGAKVDAKDTNTLTPLYYACIHGYQDIAELLLARGADVNAKNEQGYTLLYYAIWDGNKEAVELLVSKGANVNAKDGGGYSPLVQAIWDNDKDMVELLIHKGADVNGKDNDGLAPVYWAAKQGSRNLVELLTAKGAVPESTIHFAARAGDLAKVKDHIAEGTDVNVKNKAGDTPLFPAVVADNSEVAEFLIDKGADVNAKNSVGMTPLQVAARPGGKKEVVELLISKGADVNTKDKRGVTPLHRACLRGQGQKEVVELLIAKGANVNARVTAGSGQGWAPLHFACSAGAQDLAELLLAKGADVNLKDSNGQTPLHVACLRGHKEVVELLIARGANINAKDRQQQSALSVAKEQGHEEIAALLRQHGAKE